MATVRFGYGSCMEAFERFRFSVRTVPQREFGEEKPINMNSFSGLSREWVGVSFVSVLSFLGEKGKHINKTHRKSQEKAGTVRDNHGAIV